MLPSMGGIVRFKRRRTSTLLFFALALIVLVWIVNVYQFSNIPREGKPSVTFLYRPRRNEPLIRDLTYISNMSHAPNTYVSSTQYVGRLFVTNKQVEDKVSTEDHTFVKWRASKLVACDGKIDVYKTGHFVSLRDVVFTRDLISSANSGGEDMRNVMKQNEEAEFFQIKPGFFTLICSDALPKYAFPGHHGHLNKWLIFTLAKNTPTSITRVTDFSIIIQRYEYVNLYHTMTDFYSVFLMMKFFNKSPDEIHVLLFDTHPNGALDSVWNVLFHKSTRVSAIESITQYQNLVWAIPGYDTPMFKYDNPPKIPLIEEFRDFFLNRYHITSRPTIDCKQLRLLMIWRRDYVAHPRNPAGSIERKIANEDELVQEANKLGIFSSVIGTQMDKLPMEQQLSLVANSDILVGMHGAGLTHTVFLPSYAGLIELLPVYFNSLGHFEGLARWRGLRYKRWKNIQAKNEMTGKRTIIPKETFRQLLLGMKQRLCG